MPNTTNTPAIGDLVAIRGDLEPRNSNGQCRYTPDQLIQGKYLKHTGHGGIWLGKVTAIRGDMLTFGGGSWYGVSICETMYRPNKV